MSEKRCIFVAVKNKLSPMNSFGKVVAAFIGGALVGGVAALLLTPKTGEELRKDVVKYVEEASKHLTKEEFNKYVDEIMHRVRTYFSQDEIKEKVAEVLHENGVE